MGWNELTFPLLIEGFFPKSELKGSFLNQRIPGFSQVLTKLSSSRAGPQVTGHMGVTLGLHSEKTHDFPATQVIAQVLRSKRKLLGEQYPFSIREELFSEFPVLANCQSLERTHPNGEEAWVLGCVAGNSPLRKDSQEEALPGALSPDPHWLPEQTCQPWSQAEAGVSRSTDNLLQAGTPDRGEVEVESRTPVRDLCLQRKGQSVQGCASEISKGATTTLQKGILARGPREPKGT